jgi:peptide/nickel transport system permease protein
MGSDIPAIQEESVKKQSQFLEVMKRLIMNKTAVIGASILIILVISAIFAPYIAPYDYAKMDPVHKFAGSSWKHLFGTDEYGRDIFSRIVYGARFSLTLGICATLIGTVIGVILGSLAGYFGGKVDYFIMRFLDIFQSIPIILMTICISTALGTGLGNTILAMGIGGMAGPVRLLRGAIMGIRSQEYLEASTAINCSKWQIILKHVLPNAISPVVVFTTMSIGMVIMGAAGLSFIGLGVQPPTPEWGAMLVGATKYLQHYPSMVIYPGLMIAITVLAANMFGDGLRDAMDPKLKN